MSAKLFSFRLTMTFQYFIPLFLLVFKCKNICANKAKKPLKRLKKIYYIILQYGIDLV